VSPASLVSQLCRSSCPVDCGINRSSSVSAQSGPQAPTNVAYLDQGASRRKEVVLATCRERCRVVKKGVSGIRDVVVRLCKPKVSR
jgi:hypothetical protein